MQTPPPDRTTLDAMVAYIRAHLVKTVELAPGDTVTALSETALRFNDTTWFWTDDNAKAAELLCEPALYNQDPTAADAAIDFVLRMSPGDAIRRRAAAPELRVVSDDPAAFRIETAFLIIEGDLTRGTVRHALRFNDNRTVTAAQHAPGPVSLRIGWRTHCIDPLAAISAYAVTATPEAATLSHTSTLHRPGLWPGTAPLATLRTTYTVAAHRPSITLTIELIPAEGTVLDGVAVATALDRLDQVRDVQYRTAAIRHAGHDHFHPLQGRTATLHQGAADSTAVIQGNACPGFTYAIHSLLPDGAKLTHITATSQKRGRLHRLRHTYALGRVEGAGAAITEHRMVTGGGYYDALGPFAAAMGTEGGPDQDRATADPSMTYDIGAELNAVAVHLLFARRGQYAAPPSPARLDALTAWYGRHIERYVAFIRPGSPDEFHRVFTRGLAYAVLSLDCMLRATGLPRFRELLATGIRLILATRRHHAAGLDTYATFGDTWSGNLPFLDNHAACILALARASWHGDPSGELARTIHEAIRGIRLHTGEIDIGGGHKVPYDGLAVLNPPGQRAHSDTGFWNYKLGVTLRALHAALAAADAGIIPANPDQRLQARLRIDVARAQLAASFRAHGPHLEILTSRLAGETNSETQPWVALGLVPVLDGQIVALPPPQ